MTVIAKHTNRYGTTVTITRSMQRSNADVATLERDCPIWKVTFHRKGSQIQSSQTRYSESDARRLANHWFKTNDTFSC